MTAKKTRILVVDDEVSFTRLLKLNLEQTQAYEVGVENNAVNAVATARRFRPDLVLLDVMMPGKDGGDVAARLRAHPDWAELPIIILTAAVTKDEIHSRHGKIGGLPFLAKPVAMPELIACINQQLAAAPVQPECPRPPVQ
jgi:DNA-binding response OmpR family regulator